MAYPEQVARSFSLFVSGLSLSPTKFLQLIVFAAAVMGVTYVLGGCDLECNVTYDEDSNACAVKCKPATISAAVRVNNSLLRIIDRCLDPPIWNKSYCLWKEDGLSVGAKIKSDLGRFNFKYDPGILSCDNEWCELDIEFANGTCSGVEVSGSSCRMGENVPGFVPNDTPSATSSMEPSDPGIGSKNETERFYHLILPVVLVILVVVVVAVVCYVIKKRRAAKREKGEGEEPDSRTRPNSPPHEKKTQ